MDNDLEFLNECTNEQLKNLADMLVYNEKGQKRTGEKLSTRREYADAYPAFVARAKESLGDGIAVSVSLAPKTSSAQEGLLYRGHDYALLAGAADRALLMTYEWGYTYGPPMAVAPINEVRRVAEYALTQAEPEKYALGFPNYGYDWALPYVRGETAARSLGTEEAVRLAKEKRAAIRFDERGGTRGLVRERPVCRRQSAPDCRIRFFRSRRLEPHAAVSRALDSDESAVLAAGLKHTEKLMPGEGRTPVSGLFSASRRFPVPVEEIRKTGGIFSFRLPVEVPAENSDIRVAVTGRRVLSGTVEILFCEGEEQGI